MSQTCSLCLETMNESNGYLLPCLHEFHTDCIVKWFRTTTDECPYCNDKPHYTVNEYLQFINEEIQNQPKYKEFRYVSAQARRKNAPMKLQKMYRAYNKSKLKYDEHRCALKKFHAENETFTLVYKQYQKLRRSKYRWSRNVRRIKRQMCRLFPNAESL